MSHETQRARVCPDDELLASYVEHRLDEARHEDIERHVAACTLCADVVAASLTAADEAHAVVSSALPAAAPPRERRRLQARRLALAASLVLASTSVLGYAGGHLLLVGLGRGIAYSASIAAGAQVTIGSVGLGVTPGPSLRLRLDDVRIASRAPMAAARIELTTALARLVRGDLAIESVQLIRPLLQMGDPAPVAPGAPPPRRFDLGGSGAILALLARGALEVHDGTFAVTGGDTTPLTIAHVNGTAHPRREGVAIAFAGTLAGGRVTATGTISARPSDGLALTIAGAELALATLPYGRGRASGMATLRVTVSGSTSAPTLRGQLQISEARVVGWNPFPALLDPPSAPGFVASTFPELAAPDLALDDLRLHFAAHRGAVRIQHASFASGQVRGAGSVRAHRDGTLHGSGRLTLAPALSQALLARAPTLGVPGADGGLVLPLGIDGSVATPRFVLE